MAAHRFIHIETGKFLSLKMSSYDRHYDNSNNPVIPIDPVDSNKYNSNFAYWGGKSNGPYWENEDPDARTPISTQTWKVQDVELYLTPHNFGNYIGGGKCMSISAQPRQMGVENTQSKFFFKVYGEHKGQKALQIWFDYLHPEELKIYKFAIVIHKGSETRYQVWSFDTINESNVAETLFYSEPISKV